MNSLLPIIREYIEQNYNVKNYDMMTFNEIGMKSLDYIKLVDIINNKLKLNLSNTFFYKYKTIEMLISNNSEKVISKDKLTEDIYINGISLIYPGAKTVKQYWDLIENPRDDIIRKPSNREYYGGYIEIPDFDNKYFRISESESNKMDPQQKLIMMMVDKALKDSELTGSNVGVFMGCWTHDYALSGKEMNATGISNSVIAGRVSYFYNFKGPSMVIDTACSSSLVALHLAINSIRLGECDTAIVGGVNLVSDKMTKIMEKGGFMSKENKCDTFGNGDGYVRSEGCGVIVISKDSKGAYAKILSSGVNQDGKSNGLTAPDMIAQSDLIKSCIEKAKLEPKDVSYIECHGTGTKLGDPIEIEGLNNVFGNQELVIGSIKSQIGHTEAAAGMAGLIKLILCLNNGYVPKGVEMKSGKNSNINWNSNKYKIYDREHKIGLIGGVSSFGFSGTNAHVIVEKVGDHNMDDEKEEEFELLL